MKMVKFANSIDPYDVAHNELTNGGPLVLELSI